MTDDQGIVPCLEIGMDSEVFCDGTEKLVFLLVDMPVRWRGCLCTVLDGLQVIALSPGVAARMEASAPI